MRFERLELCPYGQFADRRLAFSPGAALHVVLGRNEAGKTTTMEAMVDFLFGVPERTAYAFAHKYDSLRIGAALDFSNGARLEARRRKGKQNTLVDAADKPVGEDRLQAALAGLDRAAFTAEFGLSQERLRRGGLDLLRAGGKLAETLAAGSASLSALTSTQKRLDEEARELFTPDRRSAGRPFYRAVDRLQTAQKALKDAVVNEDEWKRAQREVEEAKLRGHDAGEQARALSLAVAKRKRAQRVRFKLAALSAAAARLAELGPAPSLPLAALTQAREALAAEAEARRALEALDAEDAEARGWLAGLATDESVLAAKSAIEALVLDIGKAKAFEHDLGNRIADEEQARLELAAIAARLGLASPEVLLASAPTDPQEARARDLARRLAQADDRRAAAEKTLTEARAALARLEATQDVAAPDPAAFRRRLASFDEDFAAARDAAKEAAALTREAQALAEAAAALDPPVADLDALARAALPEEAALTRRAEAERAAEAELKAADNRRAELLAAASAREAEAQRLEAQGGVATRADWQAARAQREAALDRLAAALDAPDRRDRLETARALTLLADSAAEKLIDGVERAARLQTAREALASARRDAEIAAQAQAEAAAALQREQASTLALWSASGLAPGAASRMAAWRRAAADLLSRRDRLETRRAALRVQSEAVEAARKTLLQWLAQAGAPASDAALFGELHRAARDRLAEMEAAWLAAREIVIQREEARRRLGAEQRALADLEAEQAALREQWPPAVAPLGLGPQASPHEAEAALKAWADVGAPREKLRGARDRIEKIRVGLAGFAADAAAAAQAAAPEHVALAPLEIAAKLSERLKAAETAAAERARLNAEAARRAARREALEAARQRRAPALAATRAALGAADDAELAAALALAEERAALEREAAVLRGELVEIGDGLDEAALRAELADFDMATLDAEIAEAEDAQKRLWDAFGEASKAESAAQARLDALAAGRDAPGAARERREAEGEVEEVAELWLLRAVAAKLAFHAIERHRVVAQDPLVARARRNVRAGDGRRVLAASPSISSRRPADARRPPRQRREGRRGGVQRRRARSAIPGAAPRAAGAPRRRAAALHRRRPLGELRRRTHAPHAGVARRVRRRAPDDPVHPPRARRGTRARPQRAACRSGGDVRFALGQCSSRPGIQKRRRAPLERD